MCQVRSETKRRLQKTNPHGFIAYKKEISGYNENYYVSTEDIGFKNAYIFGQNEPKWQTKGLLSKGVFEHLKDKNIKRGCACVCTGRAGQKHCATGCHILANLSPSLTAAHISRSNSETWSMRGLI